MKCCFLQSRLIDIDLLTHEEIEYVDQYHDRVYREVSPLLNKGGEKHLSDPSSDFTMKFCMQSPLEFLLVRVLASWEAKIAPALHYFATRQFLRSFDRGGLALAALRIPVPVPYTQSRQRCR